MWGEPCKGRNCSAIAGEGDNHSDECELEHDAACLGAWISWEEPAAPAPALLALATVRQFLKNERAWLGGTIADAGRAAATDAAIAALEAALLAPDGADVAGEVARG